MLMIFMPVVGRLYNRVDAKFLVLFGVLVTFWSYYELSKLSLSVGFWNLVPTLVIMGVGMPFMFVTLSTISLSSVPKPDMTDAAGLYTLARRIGGNIGYALAATIVARGHQINRSYLVDRINPYNPLFQEYSRIVSGALGKAGLAPAARQHAVLALMNRMVDGHALMLAYNRTSWVFGLLFLSTIPMILLLPGRSEVNKTLGK
jgi:DHA2 family multidrug resistance protein